MTIQAQVLELMRDIQQRFDMSMLFITHDLAVIAEIAEEVVVMYLGRVVERTTVNRLFENAKHPYTQALIGSLPSAEHERGALASIRGTVPESVLASDRLRLSQPLRSLHRRGVRPQRPGSGGVGGGPLRPLLPAFGGDRTGRGTGYRRSR